MHVNTALAALIALTAAMPAGAQVTAAAPVPTADDDKKICESVQPTGSRLGGRKVCHTRSEWQRLREIGSTMTSDAQRLNLQGKTPRN